MSLVVNHNMMAMNAARNLTATYGRLSQSIQRLSSGLRVNSAADDAAGLAIREQMRADIAVLNQGIRNASDAVSMIQTAEGAMSVIDEKLIRMKELAEQAATGTYTTAQREIMNSEYQAMADEIDRIANATDFNGVKLLDGSLLEQHGGEGLKIHFGTGNDSDEDYYYMTIGDLRASSADGLRVGTGESFWQTNNLDAASSSADLGGSGTFGIEVSSDGGTTWELYGFTEVNTGDSLDDIVSEIDAGRAATGSLQFASALNATNYAGESFTIGNQVFNFTATTTSLDLNLDPGTPTSIGLDLGAATILERISSFINTSASTVGVYGAISGTDTIALAAYTGGEAGNSIALANSSASLFTATAFSGGATGVLDASAQETATGEFELRIEGTGDYQLRVFIPNTTSGVVLDGSGDGATSPWGSGVVYNWVTGERLVPFSGSDAADDWSASIAAWEGQVINTQSAAQLALGALDTAIETKDTARAALGALQNRLENTITNLSIQAENLQAAESRISDVDVATEMTEFTRNNILAQSAVSMLAQANSLPSLALSLLG